VATILRRLGLRIAVRLDHTREQVTDIRHALTAEVTGCREEIDEHTQAIAKKGSWKAKNAQRRKWIENLEYRIKDLERYRDEYIDKKHIPIEGRELWLGSYERYFLKPNGKLKRNEFAEFTKQFASWPSAPVSIDNLKALFGLKHLAEILPLLHYQFTSDLEGMLPGVDTPEFVQLRKWIAKQGIEKPNTLQLDKLHTYLVNKMNRKTYEPSEPEVFPTHPAIEALRGTEGLRIIDTDRKLRAEGRSQHHCIGSSGYINMCRNGYQALHYKGYTFLLHPDCGLYETYGSCNASTPYQLIGELESLIQGQLRAAA